MKQSALFICVLILLLKSKNSEQHFKQHYDDNSLSLQSGFQPQINVGQFDLKTALAVTKTVTFMNLLSSSPKLMCLIPPFLITDFLTQLSCNPAILNALPQGVLTGFMTSLSANPTLVSSIPKNVFLSISKSLSIGAPGAIATGSVLATGTAGAVASPAPSPLPLSPGIVATDKVSAAVVPSSIPSQPPAIVANAEAAAAITSPGSSSLPTQSAPGVSVSKEVSAVITPASQPPLAGPVSPAITVTAEAAAAITSPGTSSVPTQSAPGVVVNKEASAFISSPTGPASTVPVLPAGLPTTTNGISQTPNAYPPVSGPSGLSGVPEPCNDIPTPPITLPLPNPASLSILSSFFNKGAGNSILESKMESIFKLLASGSIKLPQLHVPVPKIPTIPTVSVNKPEVSKVFILLPTPFEGKPIDVQPNQFKKLYYKPGSLDQILNIIHKRLPTLPTLPTLPAPQPLSLPKLPMLTKKPINCLPLFSKVPC